MHYKKGRMPVLKARMDVDLHMASDLKNTGKGNLFVIFGEPDISIRQDSCRLMISEDNHAQIFRGT